VRFGTNSVCNLMLLSDVHCVLKSHPIRIFIFFAHVTEQTQMYRRCCCRYEYYCRIRRVEL